MIGALRPAVSARSTRITGGVRTSRRPDHGLRYERVPTCGGNVSPRRARLSSCAPLSRHPALPAVFVCWAVTGPEPSSSKKDTYH
ncbi:hypothetical protein OH76DRAFT_1245227 [Lentinus brumalis]|uniref:Uncharacterized protein n=1 Tax=Lentinus brumalis TaxID=2498619 RepID=A0A371CS18_9APHY|nr:hypothetical protein OH76DRAFT_1245227 [Polyporus brumalis]